MYIYIHICRPMYICLYVFTLGNAGMQLNSYGVAGVKGLNVLK